MRLRTATAVRLRIERRLQGAGHIVCRLCERWKRQEARDGICTECAQEFEAVMAKARRAVA